MANKKFGLGILAMMLVFVVSVVGCTTQMGSFTVLSTREIDWSRASTFVRTAQPVTGVDMAHIVILFPTRRISIPGAVDNALNQVPGAVALVDVTVSSQFWFIPYIYGQQALIVSGAVLIDPALVSIYDTETTKFLAFRAIDNRNIVQITDTELLLYLQESISYWF